MVNEHFYSVAFGKSGDQSLPMLKRTAHEVVGDTDIHRSARPAGEDIDPEIHAPMMDCRVKPGNDDCERGKRHSLHVIRVPRREATRGSEPRVHHPCEKMDG